MTETLPLVAHAAMLIRRPVAEVFEAFVNPEIITRFWFSKSSGRLESGVTVRWDWEMYGVASMAEVRALVPERQILIDWFSPEDDVDRTQVEWTFESRDEGTTTFVNVTNSGFTGTDLEIAAQALDSTGGFTWHLAGAKALLEYGIELNLVRDRFPDGLAGK